MSIAELMELRGYLCEGMREKGELKVIEVKHEREGRGVSALQGREAVRAWLAEVGGDAGSARGGEASAVGQRVEEVRECDAAGEEGGSRVCLPRASQAAKGQGCAHPAQLD